jgi:hypothetical protein
MNWKRSARNVSLHDELYRGSEEGHESLSATGLRVEIWTLDLPVSRSDNEWIAAFANYELNRTFRHQSFRVICLHFWAKMRYGSLLILRIVLHYLHVLPQVYLTSVRFQNVFFFWVTFILNLIPLPSNPVSRNFVLMNIIHSNVQVTVYQWSIVILFLSPTPEYSRWSDLLRFQAHGAPEFLLNSC